MSIKLKSSLLAGICTLLMAINTADMDGLKDITKPYLGEYRCESALYGKTDCLQYFSFIKFELKTGEEYLLTFKFKDGKQQQKTGKYEYDKEKKATSGIGSSPSKMGKLYSPFRLGISA